MATANTSSMTSSSPKAHPTPAAKRFHGRLEDRRHLLPDRRRRPVRHRRVGSPQRRRSRARTAKLIFEQTNCEVPSFWSQLATNVICSKYFYGEVGTPEREYSVRQLIHRVARTIADWGLEDGYFASAEDGERFYRELAWLCLHQHGAFNSPVWFNVGLYHQYGVTGAKCNWRWDAETHDVVQPENPYEYPARLGLLHPAASTTTWKTSWSSPAARPCSSSSASGTGTDLSHAPLAPREARRRRQALAARSRSCGSTTRSPRS